MAAGALVEIGGLDSDAVKRLAKLFSEPSMSSDDKRWLALFFARNAHLSKAAQPALMVAAGGSDSQLAMAANIALQAIKKATP
jgi:hypothetical protein